MAVVVVVVVVVVVAIDVAVVVRFCFCCYLEMLSVCLLVFVFWKVLWFNNRSEWTIPHGGLIIQHGEASAFAGATARAEAFICDLAVARYLERVGAVEKPLRITDERPMADLPNIDMTHVADTAAKQRCAGWRPVCNAQGITGCSVF